MVGRIFFSQQSFHQWLMFVAAGVTRKGETPLAARSFLEVAYYGMPSQVCAPVWA
jgi:hypothetical protein